MSRNLVLSPVTAVALFGGVYPIGGVLSFVINFQSSFYAFVVVFHVPCSFTAFHVRFQPAAAYLYQTLNTYYVHCLQGWHF